MQKMLYAAMGDQDYPRGRGPGAGGRAHPPIPPQQLLPFPVLSAPSQPCMVASSGALRPGVHKNVNCLRDCFQATNCLKKYVM